MYTEEEEECSLDIDPPAHNFIFLYSIFLLFVLM